MGKMMIFSDSELPIEINDMFPQSGFNKTSYKWRVRTALREVVGREGVGREEAGEGSGSIFTFSLFLIEENSSYQELFWEFKTSFISHRNCLFKISKKIQLDYTCKR